MNDASTLAFVANRSQLVTLRDEGALDTGCAVATADIDLQDELEREGRPVVDLWKYVDGGISAELESAAWAVCEAAARVYAGKLVYQGCDLVERMQNDLFFSVSYALTSQVMVRGALDDARPSAVLGFAEMATPPLWDDINFPPDIFNAVVGSEARARGLATEAFRLKRPVAQRGESRHQPRASYPGSDLAALAGRKWSVLSVISKLSFAEQKLWLDKAVADGAQDMLLVTESFFDIALPQVRWRRLLALPYDLGGTFGAAAALGKMGIGALAVASHPETHRLAGNRLLDFIWSLFCERIREGALWYASARLLARAARPGLVLMQYDVQGWAKCLVQGLLDEGTEVLSVFHSGLSYASNVPFPKGTRGHVAVWGEADHQAMSRWRAPGYRIERIGSMRPDLVAEPIPSQRPGAAAARPRVVLFTGEVASVARPVASLREHRQTWRDLLELCRRRPDWNFVIKPHPTFDYRFYETPAFREVPNLSVFRVSPQEALRDAAVAVLVNYPSTVGLDAVARGVPLIYLQQAVFPHYRGIVEETATWVAADVSQVEASLAQVISDPAARQRVVERERKACAGICVATGADALQRFDRVVTELRSRGASARKPVDLSLQWLLDLLIVLEQRLAGGASATRWRQERRALRAAGRALDAPADTVLRHDAVARHVLEMILWTRWPEGAQAPLSAMMQTADVLPACWRPTWRLRRSMLVHDLLRQQEAQPDRPVRRWLLWLAVALLAPRRLAAERRHRKAEAISGAA